MAYVTTDCLKTHRCAEHSQNNIFIILIPGHVVITRGRSVRGFQEVKDYGRSVDTRRRRRPYGGVRQGEGRLRSWKEARRAGAERERGRVSDHGKRSKGEMEFTSLCVQ